MSVFQPEELHQQWADAFNAGDLTAALSFFEPNATLVAQPGQIVQGKEPIAQVLGGFMALKGAIKHAPGALVIRGEDVALIIANWTLNGTGPDGNPLTLTGQTADVVRKQPDGSWLLAIDNPFGNQAG
jgi:uncharacterized protein (TIGR02246 family)